MKVRDQQTKTKEVQEGMIRIFRAALSATEEELGLLCLSVAEELTSSKFGFIGEIRADGLLHDIAISDPGWSLCRMYDQTGHRRPPGNFAIHGLYGWVLKNGKSILTNDPSGHPESMGIPEGHPPLHSFLGVPLIDENCTIGIIALGNRDGGYRDMDREIIEHIAPAIVEAFLRKRSEDHLARSEKNYRELVENVNSVVLRCKKDGTISFINAYGRKFFGYAEGELIGKDAKIILPERDSHGEDLTGTARDILDHPEKFVNNVHENVRRDGSRVWMSWTNRVIYDENGTVSEILSIGSDITLMKQAEEALVASRTELQNFINGAAFIVYAFDLNGKFIFANKAVADLLNSSPERLIGRARHDFMPGETAEWHEANDRKVIVEGDTLEFEEHGPVGKDGCLITWLTTKFPLRNPRGEIYATAGISIDITDRKRMEEEILQSRNELEQRVQERTSELEQERQLLQTIIDNIPVMLALLTRNREIPVINREMERLTGWSQKDLATIDLVAELYPDPKYRQEVWDHILNPGPRWKDILMRTRNGRVLETRWMNVRLNEDLQIGIGLDMTEINHLHERIRQTHKMEAVGTLAGGIAHDFNNILAAIIGFTELSVEDVSDRPVVEDNLRKVLKSALRAKELVKQILTFSRKSSYNREYISLTPIVKDTIEMLRASIPANIDLKLSITAAYDGVFAAAIEIQQIIMNLVTNAYLAMPDQGGNIEVNVSDADFAPDPSALDQLSGDYLQITVKDSGEGMSPEVTERIFEPFYTTREPGKGSGMGLAVVYGVVRDLNGTIFVESEVGSGSTFRVYIPRATAAMTIQRTEEAQVVKGSERIMFVDDEILLIELAKATLTKLGYQVTAITDAEEAIRIFSANPKGFDLIITDQAMLKLTGKELAEKFLQIRPDIPIILCTGHSATLSADQAKQIGIKAYLLKPVDINEMAKMIRSVLDENSLTYYI